MKCNYHNHTFRCGHASDTEEDYIKKAIAEGITTIGFSDHTPYPFPSGFVSDCRMLMSDMDGYFRTLLALREKYRGYIDIKIGFEAEYYVDYFPELLSEYRKYPLDYLIYAGHYIGHEGREDCFCAFDSTRDEKRLVQYVDNVIAAISTQRYSFIAHPDMMNFVGDLDLYRSEMTRLISAAKELSVPLEINLNGIRDGRYYPFDDFWRIAGRVDAPAVIGFDAHCIAHVADKGEIAEAMRYADRFGVRIIDEVELKNPLI